MHYIALLRGINVGTSVKVNMKELKALLENIGLESVATYINSGNVLFESGSPKDILRESIETALKKKYGQTITTLVLDRANLLRIAEAIPQEWQNTTEQKTDVAFLFPEVDNKQILEELPVKKEFMDVLYVPGAVIWNVKRENLFKCQLNKIASHKVYKSMTVRNVNTVRYFQEVYTDQAEVEIRRKNF